MDVSGWLHRQGLGQYAPAFAENHIDGETLRTLGADDLREIGVSSLGHRKKLLAAIAELSAMGPGPELQSQGERRQVTVLFADLAGYTELTRRLGAETMHEVTARFFAFADGVIERFGGRVDKHIGDCVMGVFGAPVAHDNDPERAVRAALAIRDQLPELCGHAEEPFRLHIGIASGQVVASGTGTGQRREYAVTGDSVNLASRLTDHAEPDEILISQAVRDALRERVECASRGELMAKGLARPVQVWRLLGLSRGPARERPFVGRQTELRQLESVLDGCLATGHGQTVHLRGEAGIGKTRLVEEIERAAQRAGFACHGGLVLDFGTATGQDAIRALVRDLLGVALGADREEAEAAAQRALDERLVEAERQVYLNDLLDLPQPTELRALYDAMDNAARNRGKQETVAALVEQAGGRQPRLLVVEDLHWADGLTLAHLAALALAVCNCPAVLVLTSRIEGDPLGHAWRSSIGGSPLLTLDLGPLRQEEAEALAGTYAGPGAEMARRCVARAGGNPLFLEQLLRHTEESLEEGVPGSIQSLVQARVDRLAPADKQALQAASVLGQRFGRAGLAHLMDGRPYDFEPLVAHFLVRPQGEDFLFAHALIRDALYDSLLSGRRLELHGRAARWFAGHDSVLQAEHLDRAQDPAAPRAYLRAARQQATGYRYERALALVARGLALASDADDVFALTCLKGEILHDLGLMSDAKAAFEAALGATSSDPARCRAWLGLAGVKRVTDDLEGAFADLARAEAAAGTAGLTAELAQAHFLRGNLCFPKGDIEGCLRHHQESLELARAAGSPELEAAALGGLGDAEYMRGRMITAHERFARCVELCRSHGLGRIEVANFSMFGHTELYFRPQGVAVRDALAAAEAAARVGHARAELNARLAAFFGLYEMARYEEAKAQIDLALTLVRHLGAARFAQPCLLHLGKIALAQGRRAEAVGILREGLEVAVGTGLGFHGPSVVGAFALAVDDPAERRRLLDEGDRMVAAGCVGHNHLRFYPDAMDAAASLGDWQRAEAYAVALEEYTRPEPLPWADFFIAKGRALAAHGRDGLGAELRLELERLAAEALRLELAVARIAVERALAA